VIYKIFCQAACLSLMILVVIGCSQPPQGEEQKIQREVSEPAENQYSSIGEQVFDEMQAPDIFTIQVAAFHDLSRTEGLAEMLKADGYQAYISPGDLEKQGQWYRVFVGDYATKEEAKSQLPELKEKFDDSFIRLR